MTINDLVSNVQIVLDIIYMLMIACSGMPLVLARGQP